MKSDIKRLLFNQFKKIALIEWGEYSLAYGDTWEEWVNSSLNALNEDKLELFGYEITIMVKKFNMGGLDEIKKYLLEFYKLEKQKML